jgi:RimJ/RimL family protein N-acetyltransferase
LTSTTWRLRLPELKSGGVTLRELRRADAPSLVAAMGSHEVARYLSPGPQSVPAFERFIEWTRSERAAGRHICFGIVPAGREVAAGILQIWPQEPSFGTAEWGFAVGAEYWGGGLFYESARLALDFAFNIVGVRRLEARAAADNARGNGALRKLGAVREGVLRKCFKCNGEYRDHVMWAILADDWSLETGAPTGARRVDRVVRPGAERWSRPGGDRHLVPALEAAS